jgi:transmembrane sensor
MKPLNQPDSRAADAAAAAWLAQHDSGRWSSEDEQALQTWLGESAAHRLAWLRMSAVWQTADDIEDLPVAPREQPFERSPSMPVQSVMRRRIRIGASMVLVASLAIGLVWFGIHQSNNIEQYRTAIGSQEAVTLADGSRITLNTRTRARASITERERSVWLDEGEAYFEVQHDPARPFVVTAGSDRVTVLGTKFSVRHEDNRTQVTVIEGRVRLDRAGAGAKDTVATPTLMTRNDAALSQSGGVLVIAKTADQVQRDLSWREGRLVFDQMTLGEIAAEFNRYNRKQMVIEGEAAEVRLGGSFDAHNVEVFARLVHEGFGLKLDMDRDSIRLSSK